MLRPLSAQLPGPPFDSALWHGALDAYAPRSRNPQVFQVARCYRDQDLEEEPEMAANLAPAPKKSGGNVGDFFFDGL